MVHTALARTIDKVRAELPGGNPGPYVVTGPRSISAYVLYKLRVVAASRIDTLPLADREFIAARHPVMKTRGDLTTTFELLEADDAAAFGRLPEPPER